MSPKEHSRRLAHHSEMAQFISSIGLPAPAAKPPFKERLFVRAAGPSGPQTSAGHSRGDISPVIMISIEVNTVNSVAAVLPNRLNHAVSSNSGSIVIQRSVVGRTQTWPLNHLMSENSGEADIRCQIGYVCFVPLADLTAQSPFI